MKAICFEAHRHTPSIFSLRPYISLFSRSMRLAPNQVLWEITNLVWSAFMSWPNSFLPSPSPLPCLNFFHSSSPLYHSLSSPPYLQASLPPALLHFFFPSLTLPLPSVLPVLPCMAFPCVLTVMLVCVSSDKAGLYSGGLLTISKAVMA